MDMHKDTAVTDCTDSNEESSHCRLISKRNLDTEDTIRTIVNSPVQWNLYNEDTIGTTVNSPVQWNLYNEDTIGTTLNSPVQWNLYNEDTIGTTLNSPVQWNLLKSLSNSTTHLGIWTILKRACS